MRRSVFVRSLYCTAAFIVGVAGAQVASAGDDAGVHAFSAEIGGHISAVIQRYDTSAAPLTVYSQRRRSHSASLRRRDPAPIASISAAAQAGIAKDVPLFEDKTLQRGDAVMTVRGIRVFVGAQHFPFNEGDFVALADYNGLKREKFNALMGIDQLPRG